MHGRYRLAKKGTSGTIVQNLGVDDNLDAKFRTRKIGCPFELIGRKDKVTQKSYLRVECGMHNHELGTSMDRYSFAGRLTEEQKIEARNHALSDVDPKQSMTLLNRTYPDMTTTLKQLYDFRYQVFKNEMQGQGVSQFAINFLESRGYYVEYRTNAGSNNILDIFFAHPQSMQLLKLFPYVVVMDSTYKTNM